MKALGDQYEALAASHLVAKGYQVIEKNYRQKMGEIDLIAWDKDYLVFIEVKGRKNCDFGWPREYVDQRKQEKIKKTAQVYLLAHDLSQAPVRFDVVEILGDTKEVHHIENAF